MILDIENKIIDFVQTFYESRAEAITVTSEYADVPETFPTLMISQIACSVYEASQDESLYPHHYRVTFRLDTFSNKGKAEVKRLMEVNDLAMQACKFTLVSSDIMTNYDRTIMRGTQTYRAIIGAPKQEGNDLVYQVYR